MKTTLILLLSIPCLIFAQGNSGGPDSPIVLGAITAVSDEEDSVTILHQGQYSREISIDRKTKVSFVGMPERDRKLTVGYFAKANLKGGGTKSLKLTQPLPEADSLGADRTSLTVTQILEKSDDDGDGELSYIEMSRWVYHSPKHGPDHFEGADKSANGTLDADELEKLLARVTWWRLSRKSAEQWFTESDTNENGALEIREFKLLNGGDGHIDNRFKRADKDKDQQLSRDEVAAYLAGQIGL